jgi:hypothetical protein
MKSNNTVTFNLQNTHKYTLGTASLAKYPDTLLALMVQHDGTEKELFISQDGELFRWICVIYNLGVIVDHKQANCSEIVWDAYLDYFGFSQVATTTKNDLINGMKLLVVPPISKTNKTLEVLKMIHWMVCAKQSYCHFPVFTTTHAQFPFDLSIIRYLTKDLLVDIWEMLNTTMDCLLSLCNLGQLYSIQSPAKELKPLLSADCQILRIEIKSQFYSQ